MNKAKKVFLATGGSGGHIFPAISVAEKLKEQGYSTCIIADKIYEKYAKNNFDYKIIDAGKILKSFSSLRSIVRGFFQAKTEIKAEKPDLIIGFGSYATLPTLLACIWTKTPFILHEQNAYIGKINKLFAKYAKKIMASYHELYGVKFKDMEKIVYTGSPIRKDIQKLYNSTYKYPENGEKFIVLITGGSAGARIFSEFLPKIFDEQHAKQESNLHIYHQVREEFVDGTKEHYKKLNIEAEVSTFFSNMNELLEKANLIIGRAGSGTLFETAVSGRPSILIPLISTGNNRQEVNAKTFETNNAGIVVLENNFNVKDFQKLFFDTIKNKEKLVEMSVNAKKMAVIDADKNIVDIVKSLI